MNFGTIERGYENRAIRDWEDACDAREAFDEQAASMIDCAPAPILGGYVFEHGDSKLIDLMFAALRDCKEPLPMAVDQVWKDLIAGVAECLSLDLAAEAQRGE